MQQQPQNPIASRYSIHADKNYPKRRKMEDAHFIADPLCELNGHVYALYCIFDGHGGQTASQHLANEVGKTMITMLQKDGDIEQKLKDVFALLDQSIKTAGIDFPGSCGLVCLIDQFEGKKTMYMANAGDSSGFLISDDDTISLSEEHNTKNQSEIDRVQAAGGLVFSGRVNGVIAVTRSFGDHHMKQFIISDPYIKQVELDNTSRFIVLACDGLWDGIDIDKVTSILALPETDFKTVSKTLAQLAISNGSTDNITVIVIQL
ncbi:Protein phosphatase 2C [Entamoeba marina]